MKMVESAGSAGTSFKTVQSGKNIGTICSTVYCLTVHLTVHIPPILVLQ